MKDDEPKHFISERTTWRLIAFCIALPFIMLFWGLIACYITLPFIMYVFTYWGQG